VTVDTVIRRQAGQIVIHVLAPEGIDLQFIYRAGLGIYWNSSLALLEDHSETVESAVTSASRMARALREEYGIVFKPSGDVQWIAFDADEQNQVAGILFQRAQ
jgi:hypothetical protein